jgi:hypothetical protein
MSTVDAGDEYARIRAAFARPATVLGPSAVDAAAVAHVPGRLESLGLVRGEDFVFAPASTYVAPLGSGRCVVTVVGNDAHGPDPPIVSPFHAAPGTRACVQSWPGATGGPAAVARHAAAVARHYRAQGVPTPSFTIVLALVRRPKRLPSAAPISIRDVNGGLTYLGERLIILWRDDHDFWKVLTHELVHLLAHDKDEARVEATALRMWCAMQSSSRAEYARLLRKQVQLTADNAARVARAPPGGTTPIAEYTRGALAWMRMWGLGGVDDVWCHHDGRNAQAEPVPAAGGLYRAAV